MSNQQVTFVSAGMIRPKKRDHSFARLHLYLNYGFLGLASTLREKGYDLKVIHGRFVPPTEFVGYLNQREWLNTRFPIFLSIPSSYAIGWSQEFCRLVKEENPHVKIVAGGRWVVGTDGAWLRSLIPEADLIVYGTAERRVEDILYPEKWSSLSFTSSGSTLIPEKPLGILPNLHYPLVDHFEDYQPSIEVSRGCGMGCAFCAEKSVPLSQLVRPINVLLKIIKCSDQYRQGIIRPYFEASYFRPSANWTREFQSLYRSFNLAVQWRCESRVDGLSLPILNMLADSGLKVVDLGLESASHRQLRVMRKTTNPEVYLKRASAFLNECKKVGVWVKVNILLFPGEDFDSIKETIDWLSAHEDCIKGVSAGPLVVYRGDASNSYLDSLSHLGAVPVDVGSLERAGFAHVHLSKDIDFGGAEAISLEICQQFMSERDYFDLKNFSYFPRSYTFARFLNALKVSDTSKLPFRVTLQSSVISPDKRSPLSRG